MENKWSFLGGNGKEILQIKLDILFFKCVITGKSVTNFKKTDIKPCSLSYRFCLGAVSSAAEVKFGSR